MLYSEANARLPVAEYDQTLMWMTVLLLGLGLVMVYSASIAIAEASRAFGHQASHYLVRHAFFVAAGIMAALVAFQVPLRLWQQAAPWLFLVGVVLLALVLLPGIGREVNGSKRWLSLYLVNLQPSEFMKLFVVLYAADYTVRKAAHMDSLRRAFLPMLMVMLIVGGLLLREPDFGAFVVITVVAMGILFLGGMNWKLFAGLVLLLLAGFVLLILGSPYRLQRVIGFMDPWADPYGTGYQLSHALIAFGRGEWFGVGLGASVEKLFYLPEAHTDFLLAVIAEELGFMGVIAIVLAFAWIVMRAFAIGRRAALLERHFAALVANGIGLWIGVQAIINIGVNTGMLPTKGLTLPLLSFGGSAITATCCAIAVLLRVDWENRQIMRGHTV
ncbi:MAG: putative lipid II flippase FtsW [Betaproteobacteria bacterium]|nr:putative lipid II flippase FtsW [Betaproteobacteria bacterium]MDH3437635.1 putative lipid II flippase FtsW [Betaproteobacteria bacterium]